MQINAQTCLQPHRYLRASIQLHMVTGTTESCIQGARAALLCTSLHAYAHTHARMAWHGRSSDGQPHGA